MSATIYLHPAADDTPTGRVLPEPTRTATLELNLTGTRVSIVGSVHDPGFQRYLTELAEAANTLALELGYRQLEDDTEKPVGT